MYTIQTTQSISEDHLKHLLIMDGFKNSGNVTIYKDNKIFGWREKGDLYPTFKLSEIISEFKDTLFYEVINLLKHDFQSLSFKDQRKCIKGATKILIQDNTIITPDSTNNIALDIRNKDYSSVLRIKEYILVDIDNNCYGCIVNDL